MEALSLASVFSVLGSVRGAGVPEPPFPRGTDVLHGSGVPRGLLRACLGPGL